MTDTAETGYEPRVVHEADRQRWTARLGAQTAGTLTYQLSGERYVLVTTQVGDGFRHRGIATTLVAGALDDIRRTGKRVTVICPFVGDFISRHPEYAGLVDRVRPGPGVTGSGQGSSPHGPRTAPTERAVGTPRGSDSTEAERTTTILVLGAVAFRGPIYADAIAGALDEWGAFRWATISTEAIDRRLRSLTSAGLVEGDSTHGGELTYRCTKAGRTELHRLLRLLLNAEHFEPFSLMPLLPFVEALTVDELADGLRRRVLSIDEVLAHESRAIAHAPEHGPDHRTEIVRLDRHRFDADRTWALEFIGRLYASARGDARRA